MLGHIQSRDTFIPIACERKYLTDYKLCFAQPSLKSVRHKEFSHHYYYVKKSFNSFQFNTFSLIKSKINVMCKFHSPTQISGITSVNIISIPVYHTSE